MILHWENIYFQLHTTNLFQSNQDLDSLIQHDKLASFYVIFCNFKNEKFHNCFHFFIFDILFYSIRVYRSNECNVEKMEIWKRCEKQLVNY